MIIIDPLLVFKFGIEKTGHPAFRHNSLSKATKLHYERFRDAFGIGPKTIVKVFSDIQDAVIMGENVITNPKMYDFMMALRFLRVYDTQNNHAGFWHRCENVARWDTWDYIRAIQHLKKHKVKWCNLDPADANKVFLALVDEVHCQI